MSSALSRSLQRLTDLPSFRPVCVLHIWDRSPIWLRFVIILRELAQHVDFEAYFDRARLRNSNALIRTSILPYNVADTATHALAIPSQPSSDHTVEEGPQCSPSGQHAILTVAQKPLNNVPYPPPQSGPPAPAPVSPSHIANSLPAPEASSSVGIICEDGCGTSREGMLTDAMATSFGVDGQDQQPVDPPESPGLRSVHVDNDRRSREGTVQDEVEMAVIASARGPTSDDVAESDVERTA
ncbi:hypothetical protein PENSPDRAFT_667282 [Peniophora sp. CONT]|nr:hypothetical protein PENSPDRAFT_667282 [Peniophora sp. CONT]